MRSVSRTSEIAVESSNGNGRTQPCRKTAAPEESAVAESGFDLALSLLRSGHSDARVLQLLRERDGSTPKRARQLLDRACAHLAELRAQQTPERVLARAVEQREAVAEAAFAKGDWRVALAALDSRDKLLGLADAAAETAPRSLAELIQSLE